MLTRGYIVSAICEANQAKIRALSCAVISLILFETGSIPIFNIRPDCQTVNRLVCSSILYLNIERSSKILKCINTKCSLNSSISFFSLFTSYKFEHSLIVTLHMAMNVIKIRKCLSDYTFTYAHLRIKQNVYSCV